MEPTNKPGMRNANDLIDILSGSKSKRRSFEEKTVGTVLEFYICGTIEESSEYVDWFNKIRHAGPSDVIRLYINSCGGDLFTAIQFMRVLRETSATIIVSVEGACMSAATLLFLMGDDYEISPHSAFMFHTYSAGMMGKGQELFAQAKFDQAWSVNLITSMYEGFLTAEEIESVISGADLWFSSEQVVSRLGQYAEHRKKKREEALKEEEAAPSQ
jgi:ATP-dependent protease ClpP protease subunit